MSFGYFGGFEFETIKDYSRETGIETEAQEDENGGKPSSYIKKSLNTFTLNIKLSIYKIKDVEANAVEWENLVNSEYPSMLVVAGKPIGNNKWLLKKVSRSNPKFIGKTLTSLELALSFEEFVRKGVKKEEGAGTSSGKSKKEKSKKESSKKSKSKKSSGSYEMNSEQESKVKALEDSIFG